jgi:hypothetical protein
MMPTQPLDPKLVPAQTNPVKARNPRVGQPVGKTLDPSTLKQVAGGTPVNRW